ncbi:hypothetical protein Poly24_28820 [Rosistilla carotiformis]|uniref:Uncharacterized protein n=1 Tax=Rosistilla carotiformis TaxID=2528017 RepID=A0A518JUE2_9BACT|nr:hypothetical protein [Rosistilla carotiformis]QDV69167.1 hypothetical protein Poly24_28820 [Rosistilla carotiformis]
MMKSKTKQLLDEAKIKRQRRVLGSVIIVCVVAYSAFVAQKFVQLTSDSQHPLPADGTAKVSYNRADVEREQQKHVLLDDANEIDRKLAEKLHKKHAMPIETASPGAVRAHWREQVDAIEVQLEQFDEFPEGSIQDQLKKKLERYNEDKPAI